MDTLRIVGAPGSPYSRKLRAVLRYRRIPYAWVQMGSPEARALPRPRVELLPQLVFPGAREALDRFLAADPPARGGVQRALGDPGRSRARVPRRAARGLRRRVAHQGDVPLPLGVRARRRAGGRDPAALAQDRRAGGGRGRGGQAVRRAPDRPARRGRLERDHGARDRGQLWAPARAARRAAARVAVRVRRAARQRPTSRLYGQLTQLAGFDPTPRAIALERAPRVVAWVDLVEDLSGLEPRDDGWIARDAIPDALRALFGEVGRVYAPFLLANADALARRADTRRVHDRRAAVGAEAVPVSGQVPAVAARGPCGARAAATARAVDAVLAGSGCEALFA